MELFQYTAGLNVSGVATVETQQLLFSDRAPVYVAPTPTPVPTATPTPAPGEVGTPVLGISPIDSVSGGIYYLDPAAGRVNFTWSADGDVAAYYVRVADSTGNTNIAKTTAPRHPAPRQYAHQGASNGTNHDPSHGGIT